MVKKPIDKFDECDEFFCLVMEALILNACMQLFGMKSLDDVPCEKYAPKGRDSRKMTQEQRKDLLDDLTLKLIDSFSNFSFHAAEDDDEDSDEDSGGDQQGDDGDEGDEGHGSNGCDSGGDGDRDAEDDGNCDAEGDGDRDGSKSDTPESNSESDEDPDMVHVYGKNLLSIGLFYLEYSDAIREGDGIRVLRCWRYLLPMLIGSGRKNYAIEAFQLLMQHDYYLSPREAAELVWSRFVNTRGHQGCNIPTDLHLEHLNRICKTAIKGLGANKTEKSIIRIGKALGTIAPVLDNFDHISGVSEVSGQHHVASAEDDLKLLLDVLKNVAPFSNQPKRKYHSFPKPRDPLHAITKKELTMDLDDKAYQF